MRYNTERWPRSCRRGNAWDVVMQHAHNLTAEYQLIDSDSELDYATKLHHGFPVAPTTKGCRSIRALLKCNQRMKTK